MRVHGNKHIHRSQNVTYCSNYRDYSKQLAEDFKHICGYCGKPEFATRNAFEIDHFEPQNINPNLKCCYNNLVYSCFQCNRKKGKKWPSGQPNTAIDNNKGFIDPATDEYDKHLERMDNGAIIPKTPIGKYMAHEVFRFDIRPIEEIWKISQLEEKMRKLGNSKEENVLYREIANEIFSLLCLMFDCKE